MNTAPKVFISYSWDDSRHKAWVLKLARQLIANGIEVTLDQFELSLGNNLSHFMERAVAEADKVILVMTENFKLKAEGRQGGVGYEFSMINAELYRNQTTNNKFLPVLRGKDRDASTPVFVNAFINLDMRDDAQFDSTLEELLRAIYEKPKLVKPELGKAPEFLKVEETEATIDPYKPPVDQIQQAEEEEQQKKMISNKKAAIQQLIAQGKTKKALTEMSQLAQEIADTELQNTIILLSAQFADYERSKRIGISTSEEQRIAVARVNNSLLGLLVDV